MTLARLALDACGSVMDHDSKNRPGLLIAAVLFAGESFAQAILPPLRSWEVAIALFSLLVAWGLLRASKLAWGVAVLGSVIQFAYGLASLTIWPAVSGCALLSCLLWRSVRADVFGVESDQQKKSWGSGLSPLPRWYWSEIFAATMQLEEIAMRVRRRVVIRCIVGVVCLFFLVSLVGNWHESLRHNTTVTNTIWAVVVTTYKVALVAVVVLVAVAVIGASFRRRQDQHPRDDR